MEKCITLILDPVFPVHVVALVVCWSVGSVTQSIHVWGECWL